MVAYSFRERFIEPILAGTKCQAICADRKRHARESEALQLHTAMWTKYCRAIGTAVCVSVQPITIDCILNGIDILTEVITTSGDLDTFAIKDGFLDWGDMRRFWRETHGTDLFNGVLIRWTDFKPVKEAEHG